MTANRSDSVGHREAVVIDIDDTLLDIGDRRVGLFCRHFPHASANAESFRFDIGLKGIGPRTTAPAQAFLADFANPDVVATIPITEVPGASAAVAALEGAALDVIFMTSRPRALRACTLADLASVGIQWEGKPLVMCETVSSIDPADDSALEEFKVTRLRALKRDVDVIACVGNMESDVLAAFAAQIPAILLRTPALTQPAANLAQRAHVGFQECDTWAQVLVEIGTFRTGERQLGTLRDNFSAAYTAWLSNLNQLCAIDVTVASVLAALAGRGFLEDTLSLTSRLLALVPLGLALLALVLAIRAFTSKYSSGSGANLPIGTKFAQAVNILLDLGGPLAKARPGDAINEYVALRTKSAVEQASAHRQFFYSRYQTNNPHALMNLRMFELRSLNYVRAYAEHLASRMLIWSATALVVWVVGTSFLDQPAHSRVAPTIPATSDTTLAVPATASTTQGVTVTPPGPRANASQPVKP